MIGVSARVTQTGTYVNCATVTGERRRHERGEQQGVRVDARHRTGDAAGDAADAADDQADQAEAEARAEALPRAQGDARLVKANGKRHLVTAKVTKSRTPVRGVAVRFKGIGLDKVVTTNDRGVARVGVTPSKAGIMLVRITNVKACNSARIGVVGVFEPPVTG